VNDLAPTNPSALLAKEIAALNNLEALLASCPPCPEQKVINRFTPGLYSRTIHMQKGLVCTSKIHKTEHQFNVSKGVLKVWSEENGWELIVAPYQGITKPGARRALIILEDTVWTTYHPTHTTNMEQLEAELIEPHAIPLRPEELQ